MTIATDDEIIAAIRELTAQYGYPPTNRELALHLGYATQRVSGGGSGSMAYRILLLRDKGRITWRTGHARTLRVVEPAE